jgi:hypothetical protein
MIKAVRRVGMEGMYLNIVKAMYDKPIVNIKLLFLFIYSHVHTLFGSILPPAPPHIPPPPVVAGRNGSPLSLIFLKRRHKHSKKDKAFLLVELRIAIQRDS